MTSASIQQAMQIACDHHLAGRLREAETIYREILALEPGSSEAWHSLGVVAGQAGRRDLAAELIGRSLSLQPNCAEARHNLGAILLAMGRIDAAVSELRAAIHLEPGSWPVWQKLGAALEAAGRRDEAISAWREAVRIEPDLSAVWLCLGNAFQAGAVFAEAIAAYRQVIRIDPDSAEAWSNLGNALHALGQVGEAITAYRRALQLRADFAEAWNNLGNALVSSRDLEGAIASYRRAIALKPDLTDGHTNLGIALEIVGRLDEAVSAHREALRLNPALAQGYSGLASCLKDQGRLDSALECYRKAIELDPGSAQRNSDLVYLATFHPDFDSAAILKMACEWNDRHGQGFARPPIHSNNRSPERRLRIGYVSPNFCDHVVGRNVLPLLREHDRERFEIFCYSNLTEPDSITREFGGQADRWRNIVGIADQQVAETIRADGIDILVDLSLHMARNHLSVFARKPAPVQVTFAGYPGGTGLKAMDYRLTDPYLDPPGATDADYREKSIRLGHSFWCYDPAAMGLTGDLEMAPSPRPPSETIRFGFLGNFCKVNGAVLRLWARVLTAVPKSRLLLLAAEGSHRQSVLEIFRGHGIAERRVEFFTPRPRMEYLEAYREIDIVLDSFPYNGHTTTLDALWMGAPVVTLIGHTVVGRAGFSQLSNLGLPELAASSPDEYVRIAKDLAADSPRLAALRGGLRERMLDSPLTKAGSFTRDVEAAYRKMWHSWCLEGKEA